MCTRSFVALLKSGPGDEPERGGVSHWKRGSVRCFQSLGQIVEIGTEVGLILSVFSLGRKQTCESFPPPPLHYVHLQEGTVGKGQLPEPTWPKGKVTQQFRENS